MKGTLGPIARHVAALASAGVFTWWLLYRAPAPDLIPSEPSVMRASIAPGRVEVAAAPPVVTPDPEPVEALPSPVAAEEEGSAPPPPEAGTRSGEEDGEGLPADSSVDLTADSSEPRLEDPAEDPAEEQAEERLNEAEPENAPRPGRSAGELSSDSELLALAEKELSGETRQGFSTVFVSRPEDQLDIARAFGEDVVLVPRAALDDEDAAAVSYRLDLGARTPRVVGEPGRPPLERFRQYRDLFAYDYARLPGPVRQLRKSVVRRDEIFLFAALIPPAEWAVVVGRRREAIERLDLDEGSVERFVMTYVRTPKDTFDIAVLEVILDDGRRLAVPSNPQSSARSGRAPQR